MRRGPNGRNLTPDRRHVTLNCGLQQKGGLLVSRSRNVKEVILYLGKGALTAPLTQIRTSIHVALVPFAITLVTTRGSISLSAMVVLRVYSVCVMTRWCSGTMRTDRPRRRFKVHRITRRHGNNIQCKKFVTRTSMIRHSLPHR